MPVDPLSLTDSTWDLILLTGQAAGRLARRPAPAGAPPAAPGPVIPVESRPSDQVDAVHVPRYPDELCAAYQPIRFLGAGGMGAVFLAEERALARRVAIKVARQAHDPVARERFLREAAVLATLKHECLPRVFSYGATQDGPWMALEYVPGKNLLARPVGRDLLKIVLEIASALEEIHRAGFLHRDVKPENILVGEDGRPLLIDFGLMLDPTRSRLTSQGKVVGTLHYVAPEILAFRPPGPASDFYSLGVTLYSLIERVHPYPVEILAASLRRGRALRPKFRTLDSEGPIATLLTAMLDLEADARPVTRAAMEELLAGTARIPSDSLSVDRTAPIARPEDDSGVRPPAPGSRRAPSR